MSLYSLPSIDAAIAPSATTSPFRGIHGLGTSVNAAGRAGNQFSNILDSALSEVSRMQNDVTRAQTRFQVGAPGASIEETMVSMQKAQLAFTSALTVRNRLVSAYTDIMNMPV